MADETTNNIDILTFNVYDTDKFTDVYDENNGSYTKKTTDLPDILFTAKKLNWRKIYNIFDECITFYPGKLYEVLNDGKLVTFGPITENRRNECLDFVEKEESAKIGTVSWTWGNEGDFLVPESMTDATRDKNLINKFIELLITHSTIKYKAPKAISIAKDEELTLEVKDNITMTLEDGFVTCSYTNYTYLPSSSSSSNS